DFILKNISREEIIHVFILGIYTSLRVFTTILLCTLFWVPIGVWIGLRPNWARRVQPVAQFLVSFPSNLLFPPVVSVIVYFSLNVNIWTIPLMILGSQGYILFNVIAGANNIPRDLKHVALNFNLGTKLWWKRLVIPAIFPYFVTGAFTGAGGAWNASILTEFVSWGNTTLAAQGLGAYIHQYTVSNDFPRIALGIAMMCLFVTAFNRLIWNPLYNYATERVK
ncbi:MAG: ABC transporter permease subunit, partial [Candidatus Paceibacterales bacterium]